MEIISVKQIREDFSSVKEGLQSGKSYMVMYRSKLLGHLIPPNAALGASKEEKEKKIKGNLKKLKQLAGGLSLGQGYTADEMNKQYDQENYG